MKKSYFLQASKTTRWYEWFLAWHLQPADRQNFGFLDGLRGIAIIMVVACHLLYVGSASNFFVRFIGGMFGLGHEGVQLFFCLSGYLVSLAFWKRKMKGRLPLVPEGYAERRFFKIYPPVALIALLFPACYLYFKHDPRFVTTALEWLTGAAIFVPVFGGFNPVMWSLTVEVQFYIILPVIMFLCRNLSMRRSLFLVPFLLLSIAFCARTIFAAFGISMTLRPMLYVPLLSSQDSFAFGVLVAGLYAAGYLTKPFALLGVAGLVGVLLLFPTISLIQLAQGDSWVTREGAHYVLMILFGCMLFFVADSKAMGVQALCHPLLRCLGIISYEWYLLHQAVFFWFRDFLGPAKGSASTYCLMVGCSLILGLVLAALVYRYFSLPILIYGRNRHRDYRAALPVPLS